MMPTIRVDDDVYEALRNLGKTGDSFSDVLRPLLKLPSHGRRKREARRPAAISQQLVERVEQRGAELVELISRHLPAHWSQGEKRRAHIMSVVINYLHEDNALPSVERHIRAARSAAEHFGVEVTTIHDKCGRQLYGVGSPNQMSEFRAALERIRAEWKEEATR
jgi:negative regulator of replication initiation